MSLVAGLPECLARFRDALTKEGGGTLRYTYGTPGRPTAIAAGVELARKHQLPLVVCDYAFTREATARELASIEDVSWRFVSTESLPRKPTLALKPAVVVLITDGLGPKSRTAAQALLDRPHAILATHTRQDWPVVNPLQPVVDLNFHELRENLEPLQATACIELSPESAFQPE